MQYLPDESELTPKRTCKKFISSIINTIDPEFFIEAIEKIDSARASKRAQSVQEKIEIDVHMLEVLRTFVAG